MPVAILHQAVPADAPADEQDVLVQVAAVEASLGRLGHRTITIPCTLNLEALRQSLVAARPEIVFNLVESLGGSDALQPLVPALVESMRIPLTGASSQVIQMTGRKGTAKRMLQHCGLPTPAWREAGHAEVSDFEPGTYIVKPLAEHASLGMTDADVVDVDTTDALDALIESKSQALRRPCFAERYIDGREFNLSLLADGSSRVQVLPPAEIRFEGFPAGKPRIVGHAAKWAVDSFEYAATVRSFDLPPADAPLAQRLAGLASACWSAFDTTGYARVDFRVDEAGEPWILEINANPCLSPDAGFLAAAQHAGLSYDDVVQRIVSAAW
ncbi:MAG: ATP-grasp domain-containing protein [Planctomyces sp.]|nr:ATP-grasp domain-containing protein [Planctomyces sp.]